MLSGVAVALSEVPVELVAQLGLGRRVCERGGEPEVQFLLRDRERVLPAWLDGRLHVLPWGNRRGQGRALPCTAWARLETLEDGSWGEREVEPVVIPAALGLDRGVWFRVREGMRGLVARDEHGRPIVYPLVESATHYYRVMTRGSAWMPCLVGELI
jgi:hypothetical protein